MGKSGSETGPHGASARRAKNAAKLVELRAMLEASEAEGGSYTTEEVRHYVREDLDRLRRTPAGS
jgi:hypothetical protein